jgi:hypothetical protein
VNSTARSSGALGMVGVDKLSELARIRSAFGRRAD